LLLFEQWFAYRLSYHPPMKKAHATLTSPQRQQGIQGIGN
jgi:hypothetical protein